MLPVDVDEPKGAAFGAGLDADPKEKPVEPPPAAPAPKANP